MDKRAINNFAVKARRDLIRDITNKLGLLGIDEAGIQEKRAESTAEIEYYGELAYEISGDDIRLRRELVSHLKSRVADDWNTVLQDFIEEVAYTWFNRIIAIRFMEVNDYLPSKTRVLSSENGRTEPDILTEAFDIEDDLHGFSSNQRALLAKALDTEIPEDLDKAYTMLFIKQANALNDNLPYLFERTSDYMQLLFTPSYHDGVIKDLIDGIPESDFDVQLEGQVEVIGWLYQYYNEEPKDLAFKKKSYKKEDIPAVTQLFTPDWVVRYMVENSIGRYWIRGLLKKGDPRSEKEIAQSFGWEYYLPESADNQELLVSSSTPEQFATPEDITVIDPAMGSGHILVYAYDVLQQIYESEGFSKKDSAELILQKNLFGLDIDNRAFQLSYFAIMMKARQDNRKVLSQGIRPNVFDVPNISDSVDFADLLIKKADVVDTNGIKNSLRQLLSVFSHGDSLGSIIEINPAIDFKELQKLTKSNLLINEDGFDAIEAGKMQQTLRNMLPVAKILSSRFTIAITNPPYMQASKMPKDLKAYVTSNYVDSKSDLFSVFIERLAKFVGSNGLYAMITQHQWMFLSSFERLRNKINKQSIINMAHLGTKAFEEIGGEVVQTTAFVMQNTQMSDYVGAFVRLVDYDSQKKKQAAYLNAVNSTESKDVYRTNQTNFSAMPGRPIVYWFSNRDFSIFKSNKTIGDLTKGGTGLQTSNGKRFLRLWHEVASNQLDRKWKPYAKGGAFRRWSGNDDYVVNWGEKGTELKRFIVDRYTYLKGNYSLVIKNEGDYFKEGVLTTKITSGKLSFRFSPSAQIFSDATTGIFPDKHLLYLLGVLNSKVIFLTEELNPTLNFQAGDIEKMPLIISNENIVQVLVENNISMSNTDWNAFEKNRHFQAHPFLKHIDEHNRNWTLKDAFEVWAKEAQDRFNQLKSNEEELNRIFIDLYGLQDELTPDVADKDVSVRIADEVRDVKSFLSYFVGLVFGRYSLDVPGLAYAGGDWDDSKYNSFQPNKDNVLVLSDDNYFNDSRDIISRLKEFLMIAFGDDNVQENLEYIAQVVGKNGDTAEERIRQYFIKDFYKDHVSVYSKRPIYWEYNSGKKEGFRALMYVHRYDADTTGTIRMDYLLPLQEAYENALVNFESLVENETVAKTRKIYAKKVTRLTNQIDEIKLFDQVLQHLATLRIEIDLDDGVVKNHEKIQAGQNLLTKIK
ncbi:BREX-1 system adenine-specific DNA-methyltransferase PglX [Weissella cibaria]|uniref:site-specific DNA-methyltransferase (adenine-specific) n=1 Tax=Weissella cibaria TaxID=137591 RepID=A0A9Q8JHI7_9LACO|nr:BREX-1 system adenine-specific DNA-methyltransferase PglX [Weissella cibaria]TVV27497.1 BREX-1 system adenine-specific DNA-methyltransferase PglX [Weissella cibaria]TVV40689.1 BREX-1 system adenine-specific DNA-methyltransferase PglX [Weissella cibaria]